jgi:nucleoredoxin
MATKLLKGLTIYSNILDIQAYNIIQPRSTSLNSTMSKSPMETLLGPSLLTDSNGSTKDTTALLKDKDLVALYFSASWCPPCRQFSPLLKQFYKNAQDLNFEIVYISSDRSLQEFQDYYATMPWTAIPTDAASAHYKNELAKSLNIRGIPALVVLDAKTGYFVTDQARAAVSDAVAGDAALTTELVNQWRRQEKVPMEEAQLGGASANSVGGLIWQMILGILKNPMYIFGILYMFQYAMRLLKGDDGSLSTAPDGAAPVDAEEPEF